MVSYLIREKSWAVSSSWAAELEVRVGKGPQEFPGLRPQLLLFWFIEQVCGAPVSWTQVKCL